jgi:hypothetical protein
MTVYYLTKYWATDGIVEYDGPDGATDYVYKKRHPADWNEAQYHIGVDAFTNREVAVATVLSARTKKIASLRKQIATLEALEF